MSNFFFFFYLSFLFDKIHKHSQACSENKKKEVPFLLLLHLPPFLYTPTHWLPSHLFFFIEKGKDIAREKEREEKEKWSYRFELHTVSILPSLNDLNKEFNTAGSE